MAPRQRVISYVYCINMLLYTVVLAQVSLEYVHLYHNHLITSLTLTLFLLLCRGFQSSQIRTVLHTVNQIVQVICSPATCIAWHGVELAFLQTHRTTDSNFYQNKL